MYEEYRDIRGVNICRLPIIFSPLETAGYISCIANRSDYRMWRSSPRADVTTRGKKFSIVSGHRWGLRRAHLYTKENQRAAVYVHMYRVLDSNIRHCHG